jgi:hypothetical protein
MPFQAMLYHAVMRSTLNQAQFLRHSDLSSLYLSLELLGSSCSGTFCATPRVHEPPFRHPGPSATEHPHAAGLESGVECKRCLVAWKMSRWPAASCQT